LRLQRGDSAGSIPAFEACLKIRPDWPEAEINLGLAHTRCRQYDEAEGVLRKLVERNPKSTEALNGLAFSSLERGDNGKALGYHLNLLDAGERSPEIYYNAGLLAHQLNQLDKSADLYRSALNLRPDFPEALSNLGHVLQTQGKGQEALECWVSALEKKPELARGYFLR
jgi:tetratricopeptide (TPR) repeat protein